MDSPTPTSPDNMPENENFVPEVYPDEAELSSGNGRLAIIVGGIISAVLAGYLLLPANVTSPKAAPALPTATTELSENTTTATTPTDKPATATTATGTAVVATKSTADAEKATPDAEKPALTTAARSVTTRSTAVDDGDDAEDQVSVLAPTAPSAPVAVEAVELAPSIMKMNGRVLDENGRPLAGATVMLKGSKNITSTDANGNYALEVSASADNTLLYGYGGYEDQSLRSRNSRTQNVTLVPKEGAKRKRR